VSVPILDNRWAVSDSQFAARVTIPDLSGFFAKLPIIGTAPSGRTLIIEPGTLAVVIDDGFLVGQITAGSYTLESFTERLQFWKNKQATVLLTRAEEVPIETELIDVPTREGACINLNFRWTVQVRDVMQFVNNLMGARSTLSVKELVNLLTPIASQAIYSAIAKMSYDETRSTDLSPKIKDILNVQAATKFQRYGLELIDVQTATSSSDDLSKREGEAWLKSRELQIQRAASSVENDEIRQRTEDLRAKQPIRQELRDAMSDEKLSRIQSDEDFKQAILDIDKGRVLRREELDTLVAAYHDRKDDRKTLRSHLLAAMDLHREQEIEELRIEVDHAVRMKSLEAETETTRHLQSQQAEAWRHEITKDREEAIHRRDQKFQSVREGMVRVREVSRQQRDDSYEDVLHQQRMESVKSDLEFSQAKRQRELAFAQEELNSRIDSEKLEAEKRRQEWELDLNHRKSTSQMDRLRQVQEMNAEIVERQQKSQVELENLRENSASQRELDRIAAMSGLSTEVLIATAGTSNAALLADLKKHEASQDSAKVQSSSSHHQLLNDERMRLYERMNEAERAKAEAIADAYKLAMQSQQGNVNQMISGLAGAAISQTIVSPQSSRPSTATKGPAVPPPMQTEETWYISLNGQQSAPLKIAQVQEYIASGQVTLNTMIWRRGMEAWAKASSVPDIAMLIADDGSSPPPMPPQMPPGPPPA
jgi:arsenate reductase-like glutaredoxin family protein